MISSTYIINKNEMIPVSLTLTFHVAFRSHYIARGPVLKLTENPATDRLAPSGICKLEFMVFD
jgi:hypothetical protein